ncbi:MAG: T9SS type A sorting domain-containing protein [Bacteroidetes bacterium]|nr:T9SS type A sorting domain-containing protein [Bacteroidota bacterium]
MKVFTLVGLLFVLLFANQSFAQFKGDNPNLDQIPQYLRERGSATSDGTTANSAVVTIDNWDNYSLGVDFAENNMATDPNHPTWFFTAYNTNETHHTENGIDWAKNNPAFGATMAGDPVVCYDSIGNLFYENMYGSISGCKVIKSTTNGATWGTSVTAIAGNDKNWLACDQTSGPYANYIYTTMTNNGVGNFARSIDNGATFTSTFAPTTQSLPGMMVCVGPQSNIQGGSVYVVTNSGSSFSSVYTFYLSTNGGSTFVQKSSQQWSNTVGSQVGGRNSVSNMRTRPYPMIAADNSYGANRGKLYCVYASNDPPGANTKSDVWCRSSSDGGATWSSSVRINDDPNTQNFQQWHPAIWCDKETGKLYAMWMDTRDTPTNDSAFIYASYSTDGGATWVENQRISNKKMKINCPTCGGGGTPAYQGDYNGVVSNKKVSMLGWTDFRAGTFQSMTGYFPDYAMAIDKASDTLYAPFDNTTFQVSIPAVKLYTDSVILSGSITPVPTAGSITFEFPSGTTITSYPSSLPVKLSLSGDVPIGTYMATFLATGPNGTPAHKRTATIKVLQGNVFVATASASPTTICQGLMTELSVNILGGTPPFTYSWTPVTGIVNPTSATTFAIPTATTMYRITVSDNASNTATDSVLITVNHAPEAPGPIAGLQSVCNGDTAEYSVVEVVGGISYSWIVPAEATILQGQNTPAITVKWGNASGDLQVTVSNDCGPNPIASILPVLVNMPPVSPAAVSGPDILCKSTQATFSTSYTGGSVTFNWSVPADATIQSGQGTETINVMWGINAGDVAVFLTNDCGTGPTVSKQVAVNSIPEPAGVIAGQDTVCQGEGNYVFSIPVITGATGYEWTLPQGVTITAGQGTNVVTLSISGTAQSGNIIIKGTNDCGSGTESAKAISVHNCGGIGQKDLESVVKIYPNPVKEELTINIAGKEKSLDLTITDLNGKVLLSEKLNVSGSEFRKKLDMSRFSKGIYFIRLSVNERSYSEKVVVQ